MTQQEVEELSTDLRVEVIRVKDKPTQCKVFRCGVLVFDGVSREALLFAKPLPQASMVIGDGSLAEMFSQPNEEPPYSSPRPEDVVGKWLRLPHAKAHFIRQAICVDGYTYGTPACGLNEEFIIASWMEVDPPENACGTCLRTTDWKATLRGRTT